MRQPRMKINVVLKLVLLLMMGSAIVYFLLLWPKHVKNPALKRTSNSEAENGAVAVNASIRDPRPEVYIKYDWEAVCKYEWEQISTYSFFRRDGAFYIVDMKRIMLLYIGYKDKLNDFDYSIRVLLDGETIHSARIRGKKSWFIHVFPTDDIYLYKIQIPFNLRLYRHIRADLEELVRAGRIGIRLHVFDKELEKGTTNELELVIRYMHEKSLKTRSAMICNRCYYMNRREVNQLDWWLEIVRRSGYEKVYLCNNTLEHGSSGQDGYEALFRKYGEYVELVQMNCMPNYRDTKTPSGSNYINSVHDLVNAKGKFVVFKLYLFETLALNMCYLKYAQDYRLISVFDVDEAILPPMIEGQFYYHDNFDYVRQLSLNNQKETTYAIERLKCNRYSHPEADESIVGDWPYQSIPEQHFKQIITRMPHYKEPESLYFFVGWQLTALSISRIIAKLDEYFSNDRLFSARNEHLITIEDDSLQSDNDYEPVYRFRVFGKEETDYARNLVKIFNLYVQPYLKSIDDKMANVSSLHGRLFFLAGVTRRQFADGKTIHNTMSTRIPTHHVPRFAPFVDVNYDVAQVIHFRQLYKIPRNIVLSIRQLMFDLNYFNCFFRPILNDLFK